MLLGEILDEINFPEGVINILAGSSGELGPVLSGFQNSGNDYHDRIY